MAIDMPPFDDPKVRQAMRLIVDREQMIDQILSGYGFIGNDLYAPFDDGLPQRTLPQREQDIDQAKSLLQQAGKDGMTVDLHTTNGAANMVSVATIFAQQAKDAGITVNVKNDPNYYGDSYLKLAFSVDFWGTRGYLNQVQQGSLPTSPVQRDALAAEVRRPAPTSSPSTTRPSRRLTTTSASSSSSRCSSTSTTSAATSSRSSTTSSTGTPRTSAASFRARGR